MLSPVCSPLSATNGRFALAGRGAVNDAGAVFLGVAWGAGVLPLDAAAFLGPALACRQGQRSS